MLKETAKQTILNMLDLYSDDDWDFEVSCFSHREVFEVEMIKRKTLGEN